MRAALRAVPPVFFALVAVTLVAAAAACAGSASGGRCVAGATAGLAVRRASPPPQKVQLIPLRHARAWEVANALLGVGRGRGHDRVLMLSGPVRIRDYHPGNALLVKANEADLATLRALVKELDVPHRLLRLQVSLLEGSLSPETAGDVPVDRGGRPTGRTRLVGQRVLTTASLLLAEREERELRLPAELWSRVGCLWGAGKPRLSLGARYGRSGEVEVSLRRFDGPPGAAPRGPALSGRAASASVVLTIDRRRSAAVVLVPPGQGAGLGPSFRLADPDVTGFVVPSRCGGAQAATRLLVITPTVLDS